MPELFREMRRLLLSLVLGLSLVACAVSPPPASSASPASLKRVTRLDPETNQPRQTWDARADTIQQHLTPPVGVHFIDATTGNEVQINGTYRIEAYVDDELAPHPTPTSAATVRPRL